MASLGVTLVRVERGFATGAFVLRWRFAVMPSCCLQVESGWHLPYLSWHPNKSSVDYSERGFIYLLFVVSHVPEPEYKRFETWHPFCMLVKWATSLSLLSRSSFNFSVVTYH